MPEFITNTRFVAKIETNKRTVSLEAPTFTQLIEMMRDEELTSNMLSPSPITQDEK
jgi:hypothetical protein